MTDEFLTYRLGQLDLSVAALHLLVTDLRLDVRSLKVRSSIWGAAGAGVVMLLGAAAQALGFHL